MRTTVTALFIFVLLFAGCSPDGVEQLEREKLFELEIGKLDDQIDLFQLEESNSRFRNRIASRDGRVYISNGNASKVMEFTGYGDLLTLLYDPVVNPQPILSESDESGTTTRQAVSHRFETVGEIALGPERRILVEDRLQDEGDYDEDLGVRLRSRILRFDGGEYVDYLGQEGVGGSPFPYIETIEVTDNEEIVVVTRTTAGRRVFWYSPEGELRWEVPVADDRLPVPDNGTEVVPSLDAIYPDLEEHQLYVKVDYYERLPMEGGQQDIGDTYSRVFVVDLEESSYSNAVDVPEHTVEDRLPPDFEPEEVSYLYRFIGVGPGGHLYFVARDSEESQELLIMHESGRVVGRRSIAIEDEPLYELDLSVSAEGILVGLLGREDSALVAWWRTDRLID